MNEELTNARNIIKKLKNINKVYKNEVQSLKNKNLILKQRVEILEYDKSTSVSAQDIPNMPGFFSDLINK